MNAQECGDGLSLELLLEQTSLHLDSHVGAIRILALQGEDDSKRLTPAD